jgi:hypothetical protein
MYIQEFFLLCGHNYLYNNATKIDPDQHVIDGFDNIC